MAKEVAISKRAKITEAQEYMIFSVLIAALFFGAALALTLHFIEQISFNTEVIMAEEEAIVKYSDAIKTSGICQAPKGSIYSDEELKKCDPDSIEVSSIPNTLRYNILKNLASNEELNSVARETSSCINPKTNKNYTYAELEENYDNATSSSELKTAVQLIKICSSLRVISDALPSSKNSEALGASINKIFNDSDYAPESISVSSDSTKVSETLNSLSYSFNVESDFETALKVLTNIERSIREFDISSATISWESDISLSLQFQATAYYINPITISETTKTIKPKGASK